MNRIAEFAKINRRNPTEPEVRLWRHISGSQLGGFKFRRQYQVGRRILDFFCPAIALGIEIDGHTHDPDVDLKADAILAQQGVTVIRFANTDVMTNREGVLLTILATARSRPARRGSTAVPHPNSSPEGEGLLS